MFCFIGADTLVIPVVSIVIAYAKNGMRGAFHFTLKLCPFVTLLYSETVTTKEEKCYERDKLFHYATGPVISKMSLCQSVSASTFM
jgi:hypothetical protein